MVATTAPGTMKGRVLPQFYFGLMQAGPVRTLLGCVLWAALILFMPHTQAQSVAAQDGSAPRRIMTLGELQQIRVDAATLTDTNRRLTPAAVTTIHHEMIWQSGARNLFELLDIYVPNLQITRHHATLPHIGIRGIFGDRDDKHLILVNGHVMNNLTQFGAFSERDLPLLQDIEQIQVVRGPGSAIYGAGPLSGIINIQTFNAATFVGTSVTTRLGVIEEYAAVDMRHGRRLADGSGLFFYYGVGKNWGANQQDAPYVIGYSFTSQDGVDVQAGQPVPFDIANDNSGHRGMLKHKLHIEYTKDKLQAWLRLTRGGMTGMVPRHLLAPKPTGSANADKTIANLITASSGYQQVVIHVKDQFTLSDTVRLEGELSFERFDTERLPSFETIDIHLHREQKWRLKLTGQWQPTTSHALAIGAEYAKHNLGLDSDLYADIPAATGRQKPVENAWQTNTVSLFAEHQWSVNSHWTWFLGGRVDQHTYVEPLYSPRAALIYTPNMEDTVKFMASRSQRIPFEDNLRDDYLRDGQKGEDESIDVLEFRFERQHDEHIWWASSLFHQELNLVAKNSGENSIQNLGTLTSY